MHWIARASRQMSPKQARSGLPRLALTAMRRRLRGRSEYLPRAQVPSRGEIGRALKTLRSAAVATRAQASRCGGLSRFVLALIEHGLAAGSPRTLNRAAIELDLLTAQLLLDHGKQRTAADLCHVPAGRGAVVEGIGALTGYRHELLGHLLSGRLFVEPAIVTLDNQAKPAIALHQGLKFLHLLSGSAVYRHGEHLVRVRTGDSLLFDAAAPHGIETIVHGPVSFLSINFTLGD